MLAGPGNVEAHASAQRRSLPRPAHVSRRHGASSSLAARPAATDLRPQQSSRAPRDWQGSTLSTQALRTRPLHGLQRGEDPEDQAIAGSVQRGARMGPGRGEVGGASAAPGRGAPGRPGRCRCIHWSRQLFINARPRPRLPRCPAPSRAAHTGRKRYTSAPRLDVASTFGGRS